MKKIIILFIVLIFIIGCSSGTENADNKETLTFEQTESIADASEGNKLPAPKLTEYNLNGRAFNILVPQSVGWVNSRDYEIFPELSGEPVNDAVQARIIAVEELYNCVIKPIYSGTMIADARKDILAEGNAYDILIPAMTEVSQIAGEGLLLDMYTLGALYFEMPWWNSSACDNLSIMGKLYYTLGDVTLIAYDGLSTMIFNKELLISNNLETPYQYVYNKTWTYDKLYSMCKGVSRDLNGDGIMDKDDQYGLLADNNSIIFMLYAGGERLVKKNSDDIPYPTINTDRVIRIVDKILEIYGDSTTTSPTSVFGDHGAANAPFMNNQILFRITSMFRTTQIREMESDFGFIPQPKFDELQADFQHTYSYASPGVAIPMNVPNPQENGAVLEALAYYGRLTVLPAYYEINLQTKITRDEDSVVMLDIIFNTATTDLGFVYNFGGMREMFTSFVRNNSNTFSSAYASIEPVIYADIEKLVENFKAVS